MIVLAMDTTGKSISCAVARDGGILSSVYRNCGLTHSETLMPAVDEVLRAAGVEKSDIDCIACVTGPGSFTGVRIGVCAARGMAHGLGCRVAAVDALQAIAENLPFADGIVCPMLDARRSQVYAAAFRVSNGGAVRMIEDGAMALTDFLDRLPDDGRLIFAGDGALANRQAIAERFSGRAAFAPEQSAWPRADAASLIASRDEGNWMKPEELLPLYLRAPQAERERAERLAQNG